MGRESACSFIVPQDVQYIKSIGKWCETTWEGDLTGVWSQHIDGIISKWTSLSLGNVPLLENVWLLWQLPSQWHFWNPALTAIIPSQSSTPRLPGSGLVSIFSQRSLTQGIGRKVVAMEHQPCSLHGVLLATFLVPDKTPQGKAFYCGLWFKE